MKLSYRETLATDVSKLNAKFDKFIVGYMAEISVVKRTGYFQDFSTVVARYVGDIAFCSDGRYAGYAFERDFALNIDGVPIVATLSLELSGNRFVVSTCNSSVYVKKAEIKKVFDKIDENTYWPNGYNVGEYEPSGHDFYVSGRIKQMAQQ